MILMANNINAEQLILVVDKLTGSCYPYGDVVVDDERRENLKLKMDLVSHLLDEISMASKLYERPEISIALIAQNARNYLKDIRMWLNDMEYLGSED